MSIAAPAEPRTARPPRGWRTPTWTAVVFVAGAAACYGGLRAAGLLLPPPAAPEPASAPTPEPTADADAVVRLPASVWSSVGLRVEPAAVAPFTERVWRTGRLALDESRVAHISPTVEGLVREVRVRLGQDVQAGDVLAVLESREVGQAKLDLVKTRTAADFARMQDEWTRTISRNAAELVEAMTAGASVADLDGRFKDRPIGDLRQQLVTAYSRRLQTKAHYQAADAPDARGAVPSSTVVRLRADAEAADAAFRALCEEVKYQTGQQVRASEQRLREARNAEALSRTQLLMLGYSAAEVDKLDPIAEGPAVSHYPLRAPFRGTVIEQHAVRAERVGPQVQMFQLADLTTLWLQADVPQKDIRLARSLAGGKVRFRPADDPTAVRDGEVFYTGDVVADATRTVALTATVANADRALKPGLFVEAELTRPGPDAVQVPAAAVQRDGPRAFVFVHDGGDRFRRVDVTLGRTSGGAVEVVGGLTAGQPVVVAGGFTLKSELFKDQIAGE